MDHDGNVFESPSSDELAACCSVCRVGAIMAQSRLHQSRNYHAYKRVPFQAVVSASSNCLVCELVTGAVRTWIADETRQVRVGAVSLTILGFGGKSRVYITFYEAVDALGTEGLGTEIDVFRLKGIESPWNTREITETSGDASSLQAALTVKQWLQECQQNHETCRVKSQSESIPDRVLELEGDRIILRHGRDLTSPLPYACLSHCWGPKGPSFKLTSETAEALKGGVLVRAMPKTFQDAIKFCKNIDVRYLWIDALCIFQDNKKDWERAAASMAEIYENASITIAATGSKDSDQGCFSRAGDYWRTKSIHGTGLFVRRRKPAFPVYWESPLDNNHWPLLSRAWVYQERKLSPRIIHLAQVQLHWECKSTFLSEDGSKSIEYSKGPSMLSTLKKPISNPNDAWKTAVHHYSGLDITFDSDRLPAISALVKRIQTLRPHDTYVAGMWISTLLSDLAWVVKSKPPKPRPTTAYPTWSWVSVQQGVEFYSLSLLHSVQLINASYKIVGPAHVGHTVHASITVLGPFLTIEFTSYKWILFKIRNTMCFNLKLDADVVRAELYHDGQGIDFDYRTAEPPILPGQELALLLLGTRSDETLCSGILLRATENETWERIGSLVVIFDHEPGSVRVGLNERRCKELPLKQFKIV